MPSQEKEDEGGEEERVFNLLILLEHERNCGYVARKLYTQAASQDQLVSAIRKAFSIEHPIHISYFDTEYQSYVVPIDFGEIPSKGKIKVRDGRGRRPTEEDLHSLLALKINDSSKDGINRNIKKIDSFLSSEELYQMLWTLLIVIANNLPERDALQVTPPNLFHEANRARTIRAKTAGEAQISHHDRAGSSICEFISLVHSVANIFPDSNTRIVLKSVLQDYDLKEQAERISSIREAKDWIRCMFSRVNEALHNTFDGEYNQHTLSTQDELAEFQATWFPITETNLSEYKLEVNLSQKPKESIEDKIQNEFAFSGVLKRRESALIDESNEKDIRQRRNSFSYIAGEKFSPFGSIPDEILIYLFDFLDPHQLHIVHKVCKRWSMLAAEPFLWKKLFKLNWKLRSDWMGNWDVFIMYSGDNWMRAFNQWYYWELANSLLNQKDSDENIIYGKEVDDDNLTLNSLMIPLVSKNLITKDKNIDDEKEETKNEKKEEPEENIQINIPIIPSTSPPKNISRSIPTPQNYVNTNPQKLSSSVPAVLEDSRVNSDSSLRSNNTFKEKEKEKEKDNINEPTTNANTNANATSTWKIGKKRRSTNIRTLTPLAESDSQKRIIDINKEDISKEDSNKEDTNTNRENVKVQRMRSYQMMVGLIDKAIHPDSENAVLPDISILLPPCLLPRFSTFKRFTIPSPCFERTPSTKNVIERATLLKLLERLTTPYSHDLHYMKTFMLTYTYFTTPQTLLQLLVRRYFISPGDKLSEEELKEWEEQVKKPVKLRVFNILKFWLENYEIDFEPHLMTSMKEFAKKALPPIMSKQILRVIVHKRGGERPKTLTDYQFNAAPPYPDVPKNIFSQTLQIWDVSDLEISRQLTIIEFNLFSAIRPRELLNQSWKHPKRKKISPNILNMLSRFQELSTKWVPQMIEQEPVLKQKVKVLKRLINIASELMKLNNFHDAMAILEGIRVNCVTRFPRIWADLPNKFKKDFLTLEDILNYEERYKAHLPDRHPCIPHLDFHLKKLVAVEAIVPSSMGHMVNFSKCRYIYKLVSELTAFQQTPYNLQPVTQIADLLQNFDEMDNNNPDPNFNLNEEG